MPVTSVKSSTLARFNCSIDPKYLMREFFLTLPIPDKLSMEDLVVNFLAFFFCKVIANLCVSSLISWMEW